MLKENYKKVAYGKSTNLKFNYSIYGFIVNTNLDFTPGRILARMKECPQPINGSTSGYFVDSKMRTNLNFNNNDPYSQFLIEIKNITQTKFELRINVDWSNTDIEWIAIE